MRRSVIRPLLFLLAVLLVPLARADIADQARCQTRIAGQGARYAQRVIRSTLKCTDAISKCQIQCELGEYGPPCDPDPQPGCCDPDDPNSNPTFGECMYHAQLTCDSETAKIAKFELSKQASITAACSNLTQDELCGSQAEGLNFATLNAGCAAIIPGYTCSLANMIQCVGGPLERTLLDQISATLDPRAPDAVAALNLHANFPDIPLTRKVKGTLAAGKVDIYALSGEAGDQVIARVKTGNDGNHQSTLHPGLTLIASDGSTPIANVTVRQADCGVDNVCGQKCPVFKRTLPFDGTFHIAVSSLPGGGCAGGKYKLVVVSPSGSQPVLVADDVDP
jgi:hypothetical protein